MVSILIVKPSRGFVASYERLPKYSRVFPLVLPYLYPCTLMAQHGSLFTTVAVAMERYVTSCHPHK